MKKATVFAISLFALLMIGLTTTSFVLHKETSTDMLSRTVTVYFNFVKVGENAFSHQTTSGEFDSDNMTIIINGKSCNVKECSYYKLRNQGLEVDDPRADYQYEAFCSSLKGNTAYFN
jgi:hypothetical protein